MAFTKIEVGTEYVYGTMHEDGAFTPMFCNSRNNPSHPCRVTPLKVGPKWSYALLSGSDKPRRIATDGLIPVREAKSAYLLALLKYGSDVEFARRCVGAL